MCISCSDSIHGYEKGQVNTAYKKGTHNKAEGHGTIRIRPLFLMLFTRAQRQEYNGMFSQTKIRKGTKQFALKAVTVGVRVSHVADLAQSSSSVLHVRQPNSRDGGDRSLLRSRG